MDQIDVATFDDGILILFFFPSWSTLVTGARTMVREKPRRLRPRTPEGLSLLWRGT
jgi:hypothetical protein